MTELKELTKTLAIELTILTTDLWIAEIHPDSWQTKVTDGKAWITLSLDQSHKAPRLKAWASVPIGTEALRDHEIITASADRTPQAIALDIHRRLYDHAVTYLQECREYTEKLNRQERKENLIRNLLKPYLQYEGMYKTLHGSGVRAEIRSSYIEMKIDATPTQAIKILKLLKENK